MRYDRCAHFEHPEEGWVSSRPTHPQKVSAATCPRKSENTSSIQPERDVPRQAAPDTAVPPEFMGRGHAHTHDNNQFLIAIDRHSLPGNLVAARMQAPRGSSSGLPPAPSGEAGGSKAAADSDDEVSNSLSLL